MWKRLFLILCLLPMMGMQAIGIRSITTPFFRITYENNVSAKTARDVGRNLENAYAKFRKKLATALSHRVDVNLYATSDRLTSEVHSKFFDDGLYKKGKIYLAASSAAENRPHNVCARVAARAILDENQACPAWLAEAYSLYAGNDLKRFGQPSRWSMTSFADLAEDYSRAERVVDQHEVYAKLASTIAFLDARYGEPTVDSLFARFKIGTSPDKVFESVFGEKMSAVERAWSKALASSLRK